MKKTLENIFLSVSSAAALYTVVEIFLQSLGTSICVTEGCTAVSRHTRFGDLSILLIGLGLFLSLAALCALDRRAGNGRYGNFVDLLLIASLAAEGFFTGYQAFHISTPCVFCLSIFGIIAVLAVLRLLSGERAVIAGFASFAAVFVFLYLVLPAGGSARLPQDAKLVLFYSDDCKRCAEIRKEIEERKIAVAHLPVNEHADFLKSMGIEHVPTLFVNEQYQKLFLTGKESIECFLFGKERGQKPGKKTAAGTAPKPAGGPAGGTAPLNLLNGPIEIFTPSGAPGVCKETEECK